MDAMKYSMEADKYRSAYMPPSSLAMSMYSDPKYMDNTSKNYLDRSYLDQQALTKAYLESSKIYLESTQNQSKYNSQDLSPRSSSISSNYGNPLDINKMYNNTDMPSGGSGGCHPQSASPRSVDSPSNDQQNTTKTSIQMNERHDAASTESTSTSTSSAAPSPGGLPSYYPAMQQTGGLPGLLPMSQYAVATQQYQHVSTGGSTSAPGSEFRRPLTVIF